MILPRSLATNKIKKKLSQKPCCHSSKTPIPHISYVCSLKSIGLAVSAQMLPKLTLLQVEYFTGRLTSGKVTEQELIKEQRTITKRGSSFIR